MLLLVIIVIGVIIALMGYRGWMAENRLERAFLEGLPIEECNQCSGLGWVDWGSYSLIRCSQCHGQGIIPFIKGRRPIKPCPPWKARSRCWRCREERACHILKEIR